MNKTLELLHSACLALSITVSVAAKFLIQWCSPLHGGSEQRGTCRLYLTVQTGFHRLCRDTGGLSYSSSPWWPAPLQPQLLQTEKPLPTTLVAPSRTARHSSRDWCQEEGEGRSEGREAACRGVRHSLLGAERSKELGWNLKAVPQWCRDFALASYPGMTGFGWFVLRQIKMRTPTCSMCSYLYHCPFWQKLGIL